MSQHSAHIEWQKAPNEMFIDGRYNRVHQWRFDGGFSMPASPSPMIVLPPFSNPDFVDPEEAFIASLASCHMLFFLHFAANQGIVIEGYTDNPVGELAKNDEGKLCITSVTLKPEVILAEQSIAHKKSLVELHHQAHEACFLARSVNFEINITLNE
ncbi:OsmC family protein [Pseudoalteromonas piratica]|uniref:Peroxiredoxin n=1 Tax=Pseudoalteromonas piratica TaxID=1348114 RepID=A0A0A7ECA2_9GAMM|nr:OsmC family protein [Pseudoalteromonas piratica]AIY63731.1 peroxiredoxin [Pseudoalteromonas piratica]